MMRRAVAPPMADEGATVNLDDGQPQLGDEGAFYQHEADGGMRVILGGLGGGTTDLSQVPFGANLAEHLDEGVLNDIAADVLEGIEADLESRKDWEELLKKGMELLGFKIEDRDYPFKGAAGVFHPVMTEAVVRFQASARGEMLPAAGPVRTQILGDVTPDVEDKAERVKNLFNYWCTEGNEGYYPEFDRMLLWIGIGGNAFKKVFHNPLKNGPDAPFVLPDQLLVNYGASSLDDAERITHIIPTTKTDLIRKQLIGIYRKVDLGEPQEDDDAPVQGARDRLDGRRREVAQGEEKYTVYEAHVGFDIAEPGLEHLGPDGEPSGLPLPYIISIDRDTRKVLGLYRNWDQHDANYATGPKRSEYFVHYGLMPGTGFYYFGFAHILGGIAKGSTMLTRQLLDSGTLANFPGGLRVKGMKTDDATVIVGPCEFKEIDTGGLPIQDAVMSLPYKDPSEVLLQLLAALTEAAQRLGATADMQVGEGRQDAPVGTTIAMIEQAQKVMSAIHKRLHVAQRKELRLLAKVFGREPGMKYPFRIAGQTGVAVGQDFTDAFVDVLPVSDPNIPTQAQRLAMSDAKLKLAQAAPQLHDLRAAFEGFYTDLGLQKQEIARIMPPAPQGQPADPITEFAMALKGAPLAVGPQQNHDAHIAAHMAQLQTPQFDKTPAMQPLLSHLYDHVAAKYRSAMGVELAKHGMQLPPPGAPLPPPVENHLSLLVAQAAQTVLKQFQMPLDPAMALQNRELDLKQFELQLKKEDQDRKAQENAATQETELKKTVMTLQNDAADRTSRELQGDQKIEAERIRAHGQMAQTAMQSQSDREGMAHETHRASLDFVATVAGHNAEHHQAAVDQQRVGVEHKQADADHRQIDLDTKRLPIEEKQAEAQLVAAKNPPKPAPAKKSAPKRGA